MGRETVCKLRYAGKTFSGKALLETSEILFRGETRLKIPFSSITVLQARNNELHVGTSDGLAVFELGSEAHQWREKISHPKSLVDKLGVKPGETVSLAGRFPPDFVALLKKQGAVLVREKAAKGSPWVFLAAESRRDLARLKPLAAALAGPAALWVVYPKGQKSITEAEVRSAGLKAGLTDVKVASFNPTHTALKLVIPKSQR